jgi:hypothetical protein
MKNMITAVPAFLDFTFSLVFIVAVGNFVFDKNGQSEGAALSGQKRLHILLLNSVVDGTNR